MFQIPYKWRLRTIFPNLQWMWWTTCCGVRNVIRYLPAIWFDDWIDYSGLIRIMEVRLSYAAKQFSKYGHHINSDRYARQMLICANLLKRMYADDYFMSIDFSKKHEVERAKLIERYDQEYLFKIMGKYLKHWWN